MAKDEFDLDFDFEKEYGFDPKSFLDAEEYDSDVDLSQFSDEELGLNDPAPNSQPTPRSGGSAEYPDIDLDLDGDLDLDQDLDLDGDLDLDDDLEQFLGIGKQDPASVQASADYDLNEGTDYDRDPADPDMEEQEPDLLFEKQSEENEMSTDYTESSDFTDELDQQSADGQDFEPQKRRTRNERKPVKPAAPNIFTKFYDLYFAPIANKSMLEEPTDPANPRRRRKKSRAQIFKEVYLPPIIACVCLILVFSFAVGSLSTFIVQRRLDKDTADSRKETTQDMQAIAEANRNSILAQAEQLALGYDYAGAVALLDTIPDLQTFPDIVNKRTEYVNANNQLVEIQDPTQIPNLSFHPLIVDPARAFTDESLKGMYNRNFVLLTEFTRILTTLYNNGYVLVDFDSFTEKSDMDGNIRQESIYLPLDKKPFMLTETLINYYAYMVDGDGDGVADAKGDGFANKLVLDSNGEIKAQYIDSNGTTLVGDYDIVPILESFIKEHPDFSYRGARAILANTGDEGIFGYRCNTAYVSDTKLNKNASQSFYDAEVAGAKVIVEALRNKGYTFACFTYKNDKYSQLNTNQIGDDLKKWTEQITPILGEIDTFVFARESDLTDYNGTSFNVMHTTGFRYFVSNASTPSTRVNATYVKQNRLMVTGNTLLWKSDMFTGMFDSKTIIELTTRGGDVPN